MNELCENGPATLSMNTYLKYISLSILIPIICIRVGEAQNRWTGSIVPSATDQQKTIEPNKGSYRHPHKKYAAKKLTKLPKEVNETSGLIYWDKALWTINDGGNPAELYKLDTASGKILSKITIHNARNKDWEALTQCDSFIYIGDFGNNLGNRKDLCVYRISKQELSGDSIQAVSSSVIHFHYPEQEHFTPKKRATEWDAEAFFFFQDSLHIFTKNWVDGSTVRYTIPSRPGRYAAQVKDTIQVGGLITDAAYNAQNGCIILLGYTGRSYRGFALLFFEPSKELLSFSGDMRRLDLGNVLKMGQIEGICFDRAYKGYISSESVTIPGSGIKKAALLRRFDLESFMKMEE